MKLTGVEVPFETVSNMAPNTVLVVIADDEGKIRVVKVDPSSMTEDEAFLKVTAHQEQPQAGCWVMVSGKLTWVDPCPH